MLDAALTGSDVKVAAIEPMGFWSRLIAFLLIPIMLISPVLPAYANEAPLSERVASDVAAILDSPSIAISNPDNSAEPSSSNSVSQVSETPSDAPTTVENSITDNSSPSETTPDVSPPSQSAETTSSSGEVAGASSDVSTADITSENITSSNSDIASQGGGGATGEVSSTSELQSVSQDLIQNASTSDSVSADIPVENISTEDATNETQVIDVASPEVQEDLQTIKARLREEIKSQVRSELKKEVEREVYNGCKNLDGVGYYCIPDAKSFGSAIVENDRKISVSVQSDPAEGDKEIFLERDNVAIQLTHNSDDDAFPVLDPASDLLVWQSLVNGHWQIAYAHVNDVGVPKVNYLTNGENNFNPKVYRGRIVWQAWVDGNWEIFTVIKSQEKIDDDSLTAEHRVTGVDGTWKIKRITANNVPDMFPSLTSDSITWQSIDDGVWQVFSYDLIDGTTKRISKKGVRSESPRTALVWSEEDETGQIRLVGSDVNNSESIDFTALARRIVDRSKEEPKAPVSNTEIIVEKPTTARAEDELVTLE